MTAFPFESVTVAGVPALELNQFASRAGPPPRRSGSLRHIRSMQVSAGGTVSRLLKWRSRSETAQVLASFHFWSGTLLVKGSFNPSAGPPPSLDVYAGFGSFQAWEGTLALTNGAPGVNVFTFRLHHGTP